ncbi:MAG: hypothetical protein P1U63_05240 [Coxiellaceae bacterium]|nr:hypothetical protein [Coxiellaceae bacterium]
MKHVTTFCAVILLTSVLPTAYAADKPGNTQTAQAATSSTLADASSHASVADNSAQKVQADKKADESIESKVEHRLKDWLHYGAALLKGA